MNRHILVPLDASTESEAILPHVQRIAAARDQVYLVHVIPPFMAPSNEKPPRVLSDAEGLMPYLQSIRGRALPGQPGLDLVRSGIPAEVILSIALEKNINLIAMTTHRRSLLGRLFLGSVAAEVVRKAQLPVLLVRPDMARPSRPYQRILVAVGGSEAPRELLETVKYLAGRSTAEVVLFHARPPLHDPAPQWAMTSTLNEASTPEHRLQETADLLEEEGYVAWPVFSTGAPVEEILRQAGKLDVDLIALASHARVGIERLFEGSVAEGVLRRSPVPVLIQTPLVARKPALQPERH